MAARFSGPGETDQSGEVILSPGPFHGFAEFRIIGGKREAHWTGKMALVHDKLMEPLKWRKKALKFAEKHGRKPRAFISMSDLFHEEMSDMMIDNVFAVMALTPEISYMILTKRAERMADYLHLGNDTNGRVDELAWSMIDDHGGNNLGAEDCRKIKFPLPNVALGVSVESQKYADERIPHLLRTPAAMRFVSYEPALEAVDFSPWLQLGGLVTKSAGLLLPQQSVKRLLNLIIAGGESGPGARPFDLGWARQTVEQCKAAGVACFVKQMGSNPCQLMRLQVGSMDQLLVHNLLKPGEALDGLSSVDANFQFLRLFVQLRDKKGEDMSEWPEDLRIRQWPEGWN